MQTEEEQVRSLVKRFVFNLTNELNKLFWNNLMEWDAFAGNDIKLGERIDVGAGNVSVYRFLLLIPLG